VLTQVIKLKSLLSETRQIGTESAGTEWCLFTGADVVLAPDLPVYAMDRGMFRKTAHSVLRCLFLY
jgi:hypothetical protein